MLQSLRVAASASAIYGQEWHPRCQTERVSRCRHSCATIGKVAALVVALVVSGCGTTNHTGYSGTGVFSQIGGEERACDLREPGLILEANRWNSSMSTPIRVPPNAARAIRQASAITGTSADYLAATAFRESSFIATTASRSSSAEGMFQFIEQTWLTAFARDGKCIGKGHLARHIVRGRGGKYFVGNRAVRDRILALRKDPLLASILAARLAQTNAKALMRHIGRRPSSGEVYVTHFLGATASLDLITLVGRNPFAIARDHFPREAEANRPIFYSGRRPKRAYEVWRDLTGKHDHTRFIL